MDYFSTLELMQTMSVHFRYFLNYAKIDIIKFHSLFSVHLPTFYKCWTLPLIDLLPLFDIVEDRHMTQTYVAVTIVTCFGRGNDRHTAPIVILFSLIVARYTRLDSAR